MRRFIKKGPIMLYLLFLFLLTTSCTSKSDGPVKAYQEAHNSGDVEKELSFFAEDVKYGVVGQWSIEGKEKLRKLVEADAALNSHIVVTGLKVDGDIVTCKIKEQNDWLKLAKIGVLYYESSEFIFEEGLIKEVRLRFTEKSFKALQEFQATFGRWASKKRSQELAELGAPGMLVKENVGLLLRLLREWREDGQEEKPTVEFPLLK